MQQLKSLLLFLFTLQAFSSVAQGIQLSENSTVSILTCGVGNEVYSLFGHTAIRIKDPEKHLDIVFNYGAFDFEAPNFIGRFTKGDLQYFVTAGTFSDFMSEYQYLKRSVYEQVLDIPLEKRQLLLDKLKMVLSSDARFYTYKFIDRNCTNMAVDIVNETLGEKSILKSTKTESTYREVLYPYFNGHFYEQLGTSIIFGTKVDSKATLLFLPIEFQRSLETAKWQGKPLSGMGTKLLGFRKQEVPTSWWNNIYTYLLLLILVIAVNKNIISVIYLSIIGLIGIFFTIAGWYSFHSELANNYNILLFNPLLPIFVFLLYRNNYRFIVGMSILFILMIAAYLIVMLNKIHLLIVMPVVVTNLILYWRYSSRAIENAKK